MSEKDKEETRKAEIVGKIPKEVRESMGIDMGDKGEDTPAVKIVSVQKKAPAAPPEPSMEVDEDDDPDVRAMKEQILKEEAEAAAKASARKGPSLEDLTTPKSIKVKESVLDSIVVDLNNIKIVEAPSEIIAYKNVEHVFEKKSVYQVVAVQSGYVAYMTSLNMQDINTIATSNVDVYTAKRNLYQIIHSRLQNTNFGKIGFTEWLKMTAYQDLETLLYGIYCQTFPGDNEFDITCGSCGKKTAVKVNNSTLVSAYNEKDLLGKINEIVRDCKKPQDLVGKALLYEVVKTILPDSKIILEIQSPSLFTHLELLGSLDKAILQERKYDASIGTLLFVKKMFMLDVETTKRTGVASYYEVTSRNEKLSNLSKLSKDDGKQLSKVIKTHIDRYGVSYSVKNCKCQHCADSLGDLPINIEYALFTVMGRELQEE